jgi:hypothetical protein
MSRARGWWRASGSRGVGGLIVIALAFAVAAALLSGVWRVVALAGCGYAIGMLGAAVVIAWRGDRPPG